MDKLLAILADIRPDVDFTAETKLVTEGILDSFDIVALVADLNAAFNIAIGLTDLVPENFDSAEAMDSLINRKLT
ncbi:MAG: phosphopantetheine-binding protein [Oscillospiraceae bacterium]|nr:phosphopantetheine-binding protein [Oscillospiraceae bacterium]